MAAVILLVGTAAFVAGRMLNNNVGPLGMFGPAGKGGVMEVSINLIPARELPTTSPTLIGLFKERMDNTMMVQATSLKTGGQGIVVHKDDDGDVSPSSNMSYDSTAEVVITNETIIYRDSTQPIETPSGENATVQQTVQESTLDDLIPESFVTVWGRESGDRIIAEVVLISNPLMFKRP